MSVWRQAGSSFASCPLAHRTPVITVGTHCLPPPFPSATEPPSEVPIPAIQVLGSGRKGAGNAGGRSTRFILLEPGATEKMSQDSSAGSRPSSVPPLARAVLLAAPRPVFLARAPWGSPGLPFPVLRVSGVPHPLPRAFFACLPSPE